MPFSCPEKGLRYVVALQRRVRDARAGYIQSLEVLMAAKECGVYTKSSIMLGLGETDEEIIDTMLDLKDAGMSQTLLPEPNSLRHAGCWYISGVCLLPSQESQAGTSPM